MHPTRKLLQRRPFYPSLVEEQQDAIAYLQIISQNFKKPENSVPLGGSVPLSYQ